MKHFFTFFLICTVFLGCGISSLISYPIFSSGTLTNSQNNALNDANEFEYNVTSSPFSKKVVSLDWFKTTENIFERYKDTRVIDVYTKTVYTVQRTGGHYHADVEPINKANMQKFYGIYDNTWSWARRPVWVEINGMWVAGSINGMPHGYSLITNNGQDGHTCIHFLNSKTHGTQRVDEAHQSAVKYALNHAYEIENMNL